jgi:hypothetical protein
MNWETWDHVVRNKKGEIVFAGPFEACVSFFFAGRGSKFGWVIKREETHA